MEKCTCILAGVWFAYLLVYGALPLWISGNIYALLADAIAPKPAFWLLLALVPAACVLPSFLLRSIVRRASALVACTQEKAWQVANAVIHCGEMGPHLSRRACSSNTHAVQHMQAAVAI